ncbi:MAG: TIGR00730 family Rossman fold protein [Rhodanobacter sp.]
MTSAEQRKQLSEAIMSGSAYRLAHEDVEFMAHADVRPLRMQLELLKPEHGLREQGIGSTVVVFGSARVISHEDAQARLADYQEQMVDQDTGRGLARGTAAAKRPLSQARYYEEARRFSEIISRRFQHEGRRDFVVVTGGGPGIMEAANRGAFEVGARSIGLNITLPHEQAPNPFITPELAFRFHYFALRKMHFLMRAKALVAFPGGYGTLDELFEVLTLVQTGKTPRIPIVLVGKAFWDRLIDFDYLVEEGFIDACDVELFKRVDSAEQIVEVIKSFYGGTPPEDDA